MLDGLVSEALKANVLFANAVRKVRASLRVLIEYSKVSCRINSNPLLIWTPGFMSTLLLAKEIPSENALMSAEVRAWLAKVLLTMANNLMDLARWCNVISLQVKGPGHFEACSISLPSSNDACIAHAINSPRYFCHPSTSVSRLTHLLTSGVGGFPIHFSLFANTSIGGFCWPPWKPCGSWWTGMKLPWSSPNCGHQHTADLHYPQNSQVNS